MNSTNSNTRKAISRAYLNYLLHPCKLKAEDIEDFGIDAIDGSVGMYSIEDALEVVNRLSDICLKASNFLNERLHHEK